MTTPDPVGERSSDGWWRITLDLQPDDQTLSKPDADLLFEALLGQCEDFDQSAGGSLVWVEEDDDR